MSEQPPSSVDSPKRAFSPNPPRNSGMRARWKSWIPAVVWMLLIFAGSSDLLSSRNTFGMLNPLLRWLCPDISAASINSIHHIVRKAGHVSEYAILAIFLWQAFPDYSDSQKPLWRRRKAALVLGVAVLFACSDEFHQRFIPSRTGALGDIGFDSCGAATGLVVAWAWSRRNARPISQ